MKKIKILSLSAIIIVFALFNVNCGGGGGNGGNSGGDTVAPSITLTSPAKDAFGVALNASVSVTFSEAMNDSTINNTSFSLAGASSITGVIGYTGNTATFTPDSALTPNTLYTVIITSAVKDVAGNAMAADYTWKFTTGAAPDITPPTVSSTTPSNNAEDIAINTTITATFSEAMNPATMTDSSFIINDGVFDVSGVVTYSGNTATFTMASDLSAYIEYTAKITTSAQDLAGNPLATDYTWKFKTAMIPDTTPPVPGDSGKLTSSGITSSSIRIGWIQAYDDISSQANLQYRIYKSESDNIDTVGNIETNGTPINEYTKNISELNVTGLNSNSTYYFNVIVKDEAGNKAAYNSISETTLESVVPPSELSYSTMVCVYSLDNAIVNNTPTYSGSVTSWTVSPALPTGLNIRHNYRCNNRHTYKSSANSKLYYNCY